MEYVTIRNAFNLKSVKYKLLWLNKCSLHIYDYPHRSVEGFDQNNRCNTATFLYISQARTRISNLICRVVFLCTRWVQMKGHCCFVDGGWKDDHYCINSIFLIIMVEENKDTYIKYNRCVHKHNRYLEKFNHLIWMFRFISTSTRDSLSHE